MTSKKAQLKWRPSQPRLQKQKNIVDNSRSAATIEPSGDKISASIVVQKVPVRPVPSRRFRVIQKADIGTVRPEPEVIGLTSSGSGLCQMPEHHQNSMKKFFHYSTPSNVNIPYKEIRLQIDSRAEAECPKPPPNTPPPKPKIFLYRCGDFTYDIPDDDSFARRLFEECESMDDHQNLRAKDGDCATQDPECRYQGTVRLKFDGTASEDEHLRRIHGNKCRETPSLDSISSPHYVGGYLKLEGKDAQLPPLPPFHSKRQPKQVNSDVLKSSNRNTLLSSKSTNKVEWRLDGGDGISGILTERSEKNQRILGHRRTAAPAQRTGLTDLPMTPRLVGGTKSQSDLGFVHNPRIAKFLEEIKAAKKLKESAAATDKTRHFVCQ